MVKPERSQIIWRPRVACWIRKATRELAHARARVPTSRHKWTQTRTRMPSPTLALTHTHTHTHRNMQYLLLFNGKNGYLKAPQCYVMRALPLFLVFTRTYVYLIARCGECKVYFGLYTRQ